MIKFSEYITEGKKDLTPEKIEYLNDIMEKLNNNDKDSEKLIKKWPKDKEIDKTVLSNYASKIGGDAMLPALVTPALFVHVAKIYAEKVLKKEYKGFERN